MAATATWLGRWAATEMSPDLLPSIPEVRRIAQSLAMLDAILSPEWEYRYYSFNAAWGPGEEMASMRNGSGDEWFLLLDGNGAALKGFAHELSRDDGLPERIQREVPAAFSSFLNEPAFALQNATFCYWRKASDPSWCKASSDAGEDGSSYLLMALVQGPAGYKEWAEEYYEVPVDIDAVAAVFAHQPLNDSIVLALNPEGEPGIALLQAAEIGYPQAAA